MIHVYGTSHVSQESIELIDEKIERRDPDIIALELDMPRLNSMLTDTKKSQGPLFVRGIKLFQDLIGKKTGVMPGDEMLHAYSKAVEEGRDIALIDQDIRITVQKLQDVRLSEKVKAGASLVLGVFSSAKIDIADIPEDEFLDEMLYEFKFKFPELHSVLVRERNSYMVESLKHLQDENPDSEIVAFVGAAHRKEMEKMLEEDGYAVTGESGVARDQ